jgi:aryl-alcohol dehydrogenase-like predicted oxidoreductase
MALEEGIGIMPRSLLRRRILSGKFTRERHRDSRRDTFDFPPAKDKAFDIIDVMTRIGKD